MNSNIEALLSSILKKDQTLTPTIDLLRAALKSDKQSHSDDLARRIESEVIYMNSKKDKYIAFVIPSKDVESSMTIKMIAQELERLDINPHVFELEKTDENFNTLKAYYE